MKNRFIIKFFVLFSLVFCGCSHWDLGETVNVYIEEQDFTDEQLAQIHQAVNEWNHSLDGYLTFHYVYNKGSDNLVVIRGAKSETIINNHPYWEGKTFSVPWENGGGIVLPTDLNSGYEKYFHGLVLHELGHALGLVHKPGYNTMNPLATGQSPNLICKDMENFCTSNDKVCDPYDFPICQGN